jgi:hypothetical protein
MDKKEFKIFEGKKIIAIDTTLLNEYEYKVGNFTAIMAQMYCEMLNFDATSNEDEMSKGVMTLMKEDCEESEMFKEIIMDDDRRNALLDAAMEGFQTC